MTYANGIVENASLGNGLQEHSGMWQGQRALFQTWPDGTEVIVLMDGERFFA